jgi:hypothetical protein
MKKLIVPVLVVLFAAGMSQRQAKAGFSIGISIGDSHRHNAPVIVAPPQVISRPAVVVAPPPCEPAPVVVRECETYPTARVIVREPYPRVRYESRWDHRDYRPDYRRDHNRHEAPSHGGWHR